MVIAFTSVKLPYGWLGNMSPYPVTHLGKTFRTSEALFQALRFDPADVDIIEDIRAAKSPMADKMIAKHNSERMTTKPRSSEDLAIMKMVLKLKVEQHPDLAQKLRETGHATLVENVSARPRSESNTFWGMYLNDNGEWEGNNALGKLWAEVRAEQT